MPFTPGYSFDLGPYSGAPTFVNYPASQFRALTAGHTKQVMWEYGDPQTMPSLDPPQNVSVIAPADESPWIDDVGLILYMPDGLGGYTPSGYALTWQHYNLNFKFNESGLIFYNTAVRIVKKNLTNPLDITIIATGNVYGSNGFSSGSSFIFQQCMGYFAEYNPEDGKTYYGFAWGSYFGTANSQYIRFTGIGVSEDWFTFNGYKFNIREKDDPNDDPDNPGDDEEGGGGRHEKPNQPVPVPDLPTITAASAGFLTLYNLSPAEMSVFADDCTASDLWEAVKLLLANPIEFIVSCAIVPFNPPGNSMWYPKFGSFTFPHSYAKIDNQYITINCGDIYITPFGKNFLDFAPFTRCTIYLPYIGFRELDVNEIMGKTINVTYHCDCLSGDCIAFISTSVAGEEGPQVPQVLATFNGNCACQVPFSSVSFNSLISSSVNMLTNVAASVVKGDLPAMSGSGIVGALEAIGGDVQKSGSIGASNGYMGVQTPYLIKHIPKDNVPSAYRALKGYPSNISGALGTFSGWAAIDSIDLTNISTGLGGIVATSAELDEITNLLRGGVFI